MTILLIGCVSGTVTRGVQKSQIFADVLYGVESLSLLTSEHNGTARRLFASLSLRPSLLLLLPPSTIGAYLHNFSAKPDAERERERATRGVAAIQRDARCPQKIARFPTSISLKNFKKCNVRGRKYLKLYNFSNSATYGWKSSYHTSCERYVCALSSDV